MRRYLIYFPLLFLTVSCEIIEEDISGRAVTTIAPADDAEVPAGETLFRWRAVDRATGYELCVATEGRIVADTLLAADTLGLARSYGCRLRLEAGRYEWTVAAFNSGYETSSPALRLTVAEEPVPEEPEKSDNPESAEPRNRAGRPVCCTQPSRLSGASWRGGSSRRHDPPRRMSDPRPTLRRYRRSSPRPCGWTIPTPS